MTISLGVALLVSLYIIYNQYEKIIKLEDIVSQDYTDYDMLLNKLLKLFVSAKQKLNKIDKNGAFSTDDEVGFAFKLINTVIVDIHTQLNNLSIDFNDTNTDEAN